MGVYRHSLVSGSGGEDRLRTPLRGIVGEDLLVRRDAVQREATGNGRRWRTGRLPYGRYVRGLVAQGEPAVLHLAVTCRRFVRGPVEVYDIACLGAQPSRR